MVYIESYVRFDDPNASVHKFKSTKMLLSKAHGLSLQVYANFLHKIGVLQGYSLGHIKFWKKSHFGLQSSTGIT